MMADSFTTIAAAADVNLIIHALTWLIGIVGGSLVACLVWFAIRVIHQLDRVERIVTEDIHRLDIRITRLETWREAMIQASQTQRILELAKHAREREADMGIQGTGE